MTISVVFPGLTWGQDNSGDYVKYIPRIVATGNGSAINDAYGDIVRYRYNPIENQWKFRANKCTIKYNPMTDNWSYVYPGEVLRFNPAENNWDYQFTEKRLQYDILAEKWFYGHSLLKKEQEYPEALRLTSFLP